MAAKLYLTFLVTICASHAFVVPPATEEKCSAEEVSSIISEHSDLLDEKINNSSLILNQKLEDITNKITQSYETRQLQNAIKEIKEGLQNLNEGLCTNELQLQFELRISGIDSLELKCTTKSDKKIISLKSKAESALKKAQSSKAKATLALQKCGTKVVGDCVQVSTCCEQAISVSTSKIDSTTTKIETSLALSKSVRNDCLKKIAFDALKLEASIKEELLECKLQEVTTTSSESKEAGTDSPNVDDNTTNAPKEQTTQGTTQQQQEQTTDNEEQVTSSTDEESKPTQSEESNQSTTAATEASETNSDATEVPTEGDKDKEDGREEEQLNENQSTPPSVIDCTDEVSRQIEENDQQ